MNSVIKLTVIAEIKTGIPVGYFLGVRNTDKIPIYLIYLSETNKVYEINDEEFEDYFYCTEIEKKTTIEMALYPFHS